MMKDEQDPAIQYINEAWQRAVARATMRRERREMMEMHYVIHAFDDRRDENGGKEIPKVFFVEYTRWANDGPPYSVVARYELVEVTEGELPRKKNSELVEGIAAKMGKSFEQQF